MHQHYLIMKRITIKEMVKEILLDATRGHRNLNNFEDGMLVIDSLHCFYYRTYFEDIYAKWQNGEKTSRQIMVRISGDLKARAPYNENARYIARAIDNVIYA